MTTPPRSLQASFFAGSSPLAIFVVLCMASTAAVVQMLEGQARALATAVESGSFAAADLWTLVRWVELSWLGMFAAMLGAVGVHAVVALRAYRRLKARLDRTGEYLDARLAGEPAEALRGGRDCALGRLEETVMQEADAVQERAAQVRRLSQRRTFDGKVSRALELLDNEEEIFDLVGLALAEAARGHAAELLLADSSQAHLRRAAASPGADAAGCPVRSPDGCAAVRRGTTLTFEDSTALDACPRLRQASGSACSATCSPVSVLGRTVGVLHVTTPVGQPLDEPAIHALTSVSTQLGARLGMVRTLAATRLQARTDALTGLLNRRSFESEVSARLQEGGDHCVLLADLDRFKDLNDTYGHAVGDRALTVFSAVLRKSVRGQDVVGRHGGEEFVLLLAHCGLEPARRVLERLRASLADAIAQAGLPPFTVSMGLARAGLDGDDLPTLLEVADRALYQAKESGRDRVVVAGIGPGEPLLSTEAEAA